MTTVSGRFVWHDLMTTNRDAVIPFYRELFGWSPQPVDMGTDLGTYVIIHSGDQQIGGFVELDPGAGVPSHWIGYVSVDDVDATAAAAVRGGGTVRLEATDLPSVGRFAIIADPEGALACPFRSVEGRDTQSPTPADGRLCLDGLLVRDPAAAAEFYVDLFGWAPRPEEGEGATFSHVLLGDDEEIAAIIPLPGDGSQRAVWIPFVQCSELGERLREVVRLGGSIWLLPARLQGQRRIAIAADPSGALFGLLEKAAE